MMNPFTWVRRKVAEAVVGGFADGVAAIAPDPEQQPTSADELRQMLAAVISPKALAPAAPEEPEVVKKRSR